MKQNSIETLPRLKREHFENIFDVHEDADGFYYYNLLQTVEFPTDLPANLYDTYSAVYGDTWPFVSYKLFKTTNLWWMLLLANGIVNPTIQPTPGQQIKVPTNDVIRAVLDQTSNA